MSPNGGRVLPVRNPYTGVVDYEITPPTPQELAQTCDRLRAAQVTWAAASLEHRIAVLTRWAGQLDHAEHLVPHPVGAVPACRRHQPVERTAAAVAARPGARAVRRLRGDRQAERGGAQIR